MAMAMSDSGASRLRRQLESGGFEARLYVKQLSQQSDGDRDLQEHRQRIQALAEETAQNLKRNVYQNYRQFIETAREISYLESEMYQLSHLLTEQKSSLESIPLTLLPAAAAAGIPFIWSVLGTMTLFTFLMMLPLAPITTLSGSCPRTCRAFAAQ